ncbi:SNF2-related protein [Breznakiellaceae bacterium SP9]
MARQNYGVSPWGKWFIEAMEANDDARLKRGKTIANTGKVLALEFKGQQVLAHVRGHYDPIYKVSLTFPAISDQDKKRIQKLLRADPGLLMQIRSGELPESFLTTLKAEGINLIPCSWSDLKCQCSCPDYGDPCKHGAAVYYVIAREIDADPHVLFRLRGIDFEGLGQALDLSIKPPFTVHATETIRKDFPEAIDYPAVPYCTELILSLLDEAPFLTEANFTVSLAQFYRKAAHYIEETPSIEPASVSDKEKLYSHSTWMLVFVPVRGKKKLKLPPGPGGELLLQRHGQTGAIEHFPLLKAIDLFRSFSSESGTRSYTYLYHLAKLLGLICRAGAFIPSVFLKEQNLYILWQPFETLPALRSAIDAVCEYECGILGIGGTPRRPIYADSASVTKLICSSYLSAWVAHACTSLNIKHKGDMAALFFQGSSLAVSSPALRSLPTALDKWLSILHTDFSSVPSSALVNTPWKAPTLNLSPDSSIINSSLKGHYRIILNTTRRRKIAVTAVHVSSDFTLSMDLVLEHGELIEKIPLKDAARVTGSLDVLKGPTALARYLPELHGLLKAKSVKLNDERLALFLDQASQLLIRLGIEVDFPKSLRRELKPRLVVRASKKGRGGGGAPSYLNLKSLLDWKWEVAIGDEVVSADEFALLLSQKRPVVQFRDKFVQIDPAELSRLLKSSQRRPPGINEFLKSHFLGDSILCSDADELLQKLLAEREFLVPAGLNASLRPYQVRGFKWICSLLASGFGCILADDMGLGKTIQAITVLLRTKEDDLLPNGCLIVAPAALLSNWERELERFAPGIAVSRYHGIGRKINPDSDAILTTYQTAARDIDTLKEKPFSLLITDEAHLLKNTDTKAAQAIRQLHSQYQLALSGTPVENRLEDLRSLFDLVIPGYLGSAEEFKTHYREPIENDRNKGVAESLRKITSPFLLRRLKTDKAIISDLPDKITTNEYAVMEKEQAALYESVISETMLKLDALEKPEPAADEDSEEPVKRSALIFSLLTALKQICDHPRVYDKESPAVASLSGKSLLLLTLLEEILAGGEKVLIFSQYVETLDCLAAIIQSDMGETPLVYHGGLTSTKRDAIVECFQSDPASRILLVSLKAGGLGLNLTAASRVIHYDLWYNPAVEAQATDRSFRIGQTRNVFVHRFITKNSFEEKIDAMLSSKKELADLSISSGEQWLAKMSRQELKELFGR